MIDDEYARRMWQCDFCDEAGARKLALTIAEYWAQRGKAVSLKIINMGFANAARGTRYDVRSDMKNGLPQ